MRTRRHVIWVIVLVALLGAVSPYSPHEMIFVNGHGLQDHGSAYVSTQPWWIYLPAIFVGIATLAWVGSVGTLSHWLPHASHPGTR